MERARYGKFAQNSEFDAYMMNSLQCKLKLGTQSQGSRCCLDSSKWIAFLSCVSFKLAKTCQTSIFNLFFAGFVDDS